MNVQEYISSGAVETYVLGISSEKERAEFEHLSSIYPELQDARIEFEMQLGDKAFADAVAPPDFLKQRIWDAIQADIKSAGSKTPAVVIPMSTKQPPRFAPKRWLAAASVILVLAAAFLMYDQYTKNRKLKSALADAKTATDKIDERTRQLEEQLSQNPRLKQVKLNSPQQDIKASINVFWDSTSANVYLVVKDLVPLPPGQQYQLWAVTKGKYTSLGLFDAPDDHKLILKMNNVQHADAFAITVENAGNTQPPKEVKGL